MVGICFLPFLFGLVTKLELRAAWVYVQSKWTKLTVNT